MAGECRNQALRVPGTELKSRQCHLAVEILAGSGRCVLAVGTGGHICPLLRSLAVDILMILMIFLFLWSETASHNP